MAGALSTAYSVFILVVAVVGVAGVLWTSNRQRRDRTSDALVGLAVAVFLVAMVWALLT